MLERNLVQHHLMERTDRNFDQLTMNVQNRDKEFKREMVERLLPYAEMKGHGYWKGAEFWRQHIWIGGQERGIFETPGQNQRGYPAPIERANIANAIRPELGLPLQNQIVPSGIELRYDEMKKGYGLAGDLEPHTPDLSELVILPNRSNITKSMSRPGTATLRKNEDGESVIEQVSDNGADILAAIPDMIQPCTAVGPKLQVMDVTVEPKQASVLEARLIFECMAGGKSCSNSLELTNLGSTVVFYSWKRLPIENNFYPLSTQSIMSLLAANPDQQRFTDSSEVSKVPPVPVQRFYFDRTDGVLLPGAKLSIPIIFKSILAGVFHERWLLIPSPTTMPPIMVNFRGVAQQPDIHAKARAQLTSELASKEANAVCRAFIFGLIDGVRTPPRPSSPIGDPSRRQKGLAFKQQNKDMNFDWQKAQEMEEIYKNTRNIRLHMVDETEVEHVDKSKGDWDMSVDTLYHSILDPPIDGEIEMDEEAAEQLLAHLNENVAQLGFSEFTATCDPKATAGRVMINVMADSVSEQALGLRKALGLPPPPDIIQVCFILASFDYFNKFIIGKATS